MRAIWKDSISFGLVNIPIALYPATKTEDLRFRLLRKSDLVKVLQQSLEATGAKKRSTSKRAARSNQRHKKAG